MEQELEGVALDEAVAKAIGVEPGADYSTSWHHGGPWIERERIELARVVSSDGTAMWGATLWPDEADDDTWAAGPTALVAAMRALVGSKTPNKAIR